MLGLHHARTAGVLLAALGLGQVVALLVDPARDGATLGQLLTPSSGVVVRPALVVAALFLAASLPRTTQEA